MGDCIQYVEIQINCNISLTFSLEQKASRGFLASTLMMRPFAY